MTGLETNGIREEVLRTGAASLAGVVVEELKTYASLSGKEISRRYPTGETEQPGDESYENQRDE